MALEPPDPERRDRRLQRWVGMLGCLSALALIVALATAIAWLSQTGIFAPPDRPPPATAAPVIGQ